MALGARLASSPTADGTPSVLQRDPRWPPQRREVVDRIAFGLSGPVHETAGSLQRQPAPQLLHAPRHTPVPIPAVCCAQIPAVRRRLGEQVKRPFAALQDWPYERAATVRKRSSAEGVGCDRSDRSCTKLRTRQFDSFATLRVAQQNGSFAPGTVSQAFSFCLPATSKSHSFHVGSGDLATA
jgi:hypothetical protein